MSTFPFNTGNGQNDILHPGAMNSWDVGPEPGAPGYSSGWNIGQSTAGGLGNTLGGINANQDAMNAYRQQATQNGPSMWNSMASQEQHQRATDAGNRASMDAKSAASTQRNQLAMRGGLSAGAANRSNNQGLLQAKQGINQGLDTNLNSINATDAGNQQQMLSALPGMEVENLQPDFQKAQMYGNARQFDLGQQQQEAQQQNIFNAQQYQNQMQAWAADQQAAKEMQTANHTGGLFGRGGFAGFGFSLS